MANRLNHCLQAFVDRGAKKKHRRYRPRPPPIGSAGRPARDSPPFGGAPIRQRTFRGLMLTVSCTGVGTAVGRVAERSSSADEAFGNPVTLSVVLLTDTSIYLRIMGRSWDRVHIHRGFRLTRRRSCRRSTMPPVFGQVAFARAVFG
jgi:hypothetical protein